MKKCAEYSETNKTVQEETHLETDMDDSQFRLINGAAFPRNGTQICLNASEGLAQARC